MTSKKTIPSLPELQKPGAGLPICELWVARLLFQARTFTGTAARFRRRFLAEQARLDALLERCPESLRSVPVLIPRLRGMEDSSRFWSVWMTLDHLRIVNESMAGVITALSHEQIPPGKASTASVKPSPDADRSVHPSYMDACQSVIEAADRSSNLKSRARYEHPWFGPLNAWQWFALAGTHMGIHRAQVEQILRGLPRAEN
jgi:uncharacterized damage-inducible protein DinB